MGLLNFIDKIIDAKVENKLDVKLADSINNNLSIIKAKNETRNNYTFSILNQYNFSSSVKEGLIRGNNQAGEIAEELDKKFKDNNISLEVISERLKNPECLLTLSEANKQACIENNIEKRRILSNLIFDKITNKDEMENMVLSEAISVLSKISEDELKCLSLIFILLSQQLRDKDLDKLKTFMGKNIAPLLDINMDNKKLTIMNLYAHGLVTAFTFSESSASYLSGLKDSQNLPEFINYVEKELARSIVCYKRLNEIWDQTALSAAHLTTLGAYLAHEYLKIKLDLQSDWKTGKIHIDK